MAKINLRQAEETCSFSYTGSSYQKFQTGKQNQIILYMPFAIVVLDSLVKKTKIM